MALNPIFESQSTRRLPFAVGYVLGSGDKVLSTVGVTSTGGSSQTEAHIMAEGEWDGFEMLSLYGGAMHSSLVSDAPGYVYYDLVSGPLLHFHGGSYTPTGVGTGTVPTSVGPDQYADAWFIDFPNVTPPQSFSGMAYAVYSQTIPAVTGVGAAISLVPFSVSGIWRATRCRTFDSNGNVLTYQFTCNPTWHFVEALLRYKIKPQQPGIAGLSAAERACFNWPSIVAHAARNDFILPNGHPRFFFSCIWAADATLTNMIETILRCCRSYQFVRNGQIYLMGDDARNPTFAMTAKHLVPGTLNLDKKNVAKSPNQFVPRYRDIGPPAVCNVTSFGPAPAGPTVSTSIPTFLFQTSTLSPFLLGDVVVYDGGNNPALAGDYAVLEPVATSSGTTYQPFQIQVRAPYGSLASQTATGGLLGSNNARFSQRAPTNVQHRSHQRMVAAQAPGLAVQPRVGPVYYDCGNSTFDQTNRLMKFERDFQLGTDTGAGWTAPICGTLTAFLEAVDANGKRLTDVNPHDVISLDDWLTPEFAGDYVVMDPIVVNPPTETSVGSIELTLHAYNPNAFTDVSDDPGQSYAAVASSKLPLTGFAPVVNAAWVLQQTVTYTTSGSGSSETVTVTMANLVMQLLGLVGPTTYATVSWAGLTLGSSYVLYIDDALGTGVTFTPGFQAGSLPLTTNPPGRYVVFAGVINLPLNILG